MSAQVGDVITGQQAAGLPDGTVLAPLPGAGHRVRILVKGEWFAQTVGEPPRLAMDPWMFQQGERWVIAYLPGQPPRPEREVKAEALREAAADLVDRTVADCLRRMADRIEATR